MGNISEEKIDKKLGISTCGRYDKSEDDNHRAYEPTSYIVLDQLLSSEYFSDCNYMIDYGAGKFRVGCYFANKKDMHITGVEYDEAMVKIAINNLKCTKERADIVLTSAESFDFPRDADSAYFFNPFSEIILRNVVGKIEESWYENPRRIRLFFYYPTMAYVGYLMSHPKLSFVDEVDCEELFLNKNPREVIMIFDME